MDLTTLKTTGNTPASSPGLYNPPTPPTPAVQVHSLDGTPHSSPNLHPLQSNPHKVKTTHKVNRDQDFLTGRKLVNQYEILNEIGRGQHGKVKLARNLYDGTEVAIKIIQRFSKKRRLGKLTYDQNPENKTKREVAILKKVRHPNIVGLLEVIDDPELKKIYLVLEHVELGEIQWRVKGSARLCTFERRRLEREIAGYKDTGEEEAFYMLQEQRKQKRDEHRSKHSQSQTQLGHGHVDHWNMEHGDDLTDTEGATLSRQTTHNSQLSLSYRSGPRSGPPSRMHSRAGSRAPSLANSRSHTPLPEYDIGCLDSDNDEDVAGPLPSIGSHHGSHHGSSVGLEGTYYGSYSGDPNAVRGRSPSMADSVTSFMSSLEEGFHTAEPFDEEYSYVPYFTEEQARTAFRETVLGLEYLHYEGIVHRDIKHANLLLTKDHRIKISDFGVSYFGRPIREGESEENISEEDATDFDDDKELAKTVGTPAYFAPELCYTDTDREQPKVTEQIDVWSLGVTLYGLIYARLPFLGETEYELWKSIANDDVHFSKKRLKALRPSLTSDTQAPPHPDFRAPGDLVYEEIDIDLLDLLKKMLTKDPLERIRLREVKRHPWTLKGIDNVIAWVDDTDPSRKHGGQRLSVNNAELDKAVVPITFLERAKSALSKRAKKLLAVATSSISASDNRGESSRRRALSSAASSGTDNAHSPYTPSTPIMGIRDGRRASLRGDEHYFASVSDLHDLGRQHEHPLAQSVTASPDQSMDGEKSFTTDPVPSSVVTPKFVPSTTVDSRPGAPERTVSTAASIQTVVHRGNSRPRSSIAEAIGRTILEEDQSLYGYFTDHQGNLLARTTRAETKLVGYARSKSVDRGVFALQNKRGEPSVATSTAQAGGHIEPLGLGEASSSTSGYDRPLARPMLFQPLIIRKYQDSQSVSSQDPPKSAYPKEELDLRQAAASRTPEAKTPPPRMLRASTPESFEQAQRVLDRRRMREVHASIQHMLNDPVVDRCPPSPDDLSFARMQEVTRRARSSSSVNTSGTPFQLLSQAPSQVTSPDLTSPTSSSLEKGSKEELYPSVPSLPALVSSQSSLNADPEGDFLQQPGTVPSQAPHESTPKTITPPPLSKQVSVEEETSDQENEDGYKADRDAMMIDDDESSSDSDEGLMMGGGKKRIMKSASGSSRRGTDASVGSTETAKKVVMSQ